MGDLHDNNPELPEGTSEVIKHSYQDLENVHLDSSTVVQNYDYDTDQTFLKSVYLPPVGPHQTPINTGVNSYGHIDMQSQNNQDLSLDLDGNIQCAQIASNLVYSAHPVTQYRLDSVIHDKLDSELHDLPKELYISTALEITDKC